MKKDKKNCPFFEKNYIKQTLSPIFFIEKCIFILNIADLNISLF